MEVLNVDPVKSANDKKNYRIIRLKNGLRVLLVSHPTPEGFSMDMGESSSESESEGDSSDGSDGSGEEEEMEIDMPDTKRKEGNEKKSAAALCVGAGSFCDPDDIPGFAHFLEHMVFMGSSVYPEENDFDDYLGKHGGDSNACTDCEMTTFYFEIQRKYFRKCLDKLAHFFISPLLKKDCVDREIEAVDSEFQMTTSSDNDRVNEMISKTAKKGHPMSRFMGGNAKSLKTDPEKNGLNIYGRLRDFYESMYCANYMTLVLQSMDSLDTLQEWAVDIFSDIPSNNIPRPSFSHLKDPFDTADFKRFYRVVPMENNHKLEISWSLPSLVDKYREKPQEYLSMLILHEGKGSILSYLKNKLYALAMTGGSDSDGFGHNSTWSLFYVSITLTAKGLQNILQVCNAVFEYILMLQNQGPQHRLFLELQQIEDCKFRWKEEGEPMEDVQEVAENMQTYTPQHYLTGRDLLFEYNPQLISDCTKYLGPDKANFVLLSTEKSVIGETDQEEAWYNTKYNVADVDAEWRKTWENLKENPDLFFPEPNIYIATDFTLHPSSEDTPKLPYPVVDNEFCKMWFKKDSKFNVPKGYTYLHLMSPAVSESPENATLNDLFINILLNILTEAAYPAVLAGYEYWVEGFPTGIVISMEGFSHKMPLLFRCMVDHIADFMCSPELFAAIKTQLQKAFYNEMIKPFELARMLRFAMLDPSTQALPDRYRLISGLTLTQLTDFLSKFKSQLFIEGFVIGNFQPEEVTEMADYIQKRLCSQPLPPERIPKKLLLQLPTSQLTCRVESVNRDDCNSCITDYYQAGPGNIRMSCVNELLLTRMKEPCFDFLRTKHQLGYSVFCYSMMTNGILGLSVTVESQTSKHSMNDVQKLMADFLGEFRGILHAMTEEEFDSLVDSLITNKQLEDTHLGEEASRLWREIHDNSYVFDLLEKEIAILQTLTMDELKEWYNQYIDKRQRKLSLQVEGKTSADSSDVNTENKGGEGEPDVPEKEAQALVFLQPEVNGTTFITDIPHVKQGLAQFPYTTISL
ncbi:nardilysin-like [Haliotis rufescens]|uniref:nardilysin-like n=1 Tax=Haliotis rufescens TaxID=6454 RepID=UPI00201EF341|nr:nardilysin-like [Haliotis rufescens]XP_048256264.1 nardilysin-like [Haliotis rufescens]